MSQMQVETKELQRPSTPSTVMQLPSIPPSAAYQSARFPSTAPSDTTTGSDIDDEEKIKKADMLWCKAVERMPFEDLPPASFKKPVFQYCCEKLGLEANKKTKEALYRSLEAYVRPRNISMYASLLNLIHACFQITLHNLATSPAATLNGSDVLGYDVMEVIWEDMQKTLLPSWVGTAPPNWGTSKCGKLSANHWRTIGTIHLPITLIWLWRAETGRKRELLDNYMELITAVDTANLLETSAAQIDVYNQNITGYVRGIANLFKENSILPSHHASLHIGDQLAGFGPLHSRTAPYYERFIHLLQSQNTNKKFGKVFRDS